MTIELRKIKKSDKPEWVRLRSLLWPKNAEDHPLEIDDFFDKKSIDIVEVFVLDKGNQDLGGFIELNIRNFAEGSRSRKVPYIEGWYVEQELQNKGYGKKLIEASEKWSIEKGFKELGSDAELTNNTGIEAHKKLGFKEVERIVCFIKKLSDI